MKRFLLAFLMCAPFFVHATEFCSEKEVIINGFSKHFSKPTKYAKKYGYNEKNYGIGLNCNLQPVLGFNTQWEVGVLKNSYRTTSIYTSYNFYYPVNDIVFLGGRLIIASGYEILNKPHGLSYGPMFASKFKLNSSTSLNLSIAPKVNNSAGFLFASIGVKF